MSLVYAGMCCHAPGITVRPEQADPELLAGLHAAFDQQRQAIEDAGAEVLVMVSSEHFANFFMDNMPTFSMGIADEYESPIENPDWLKVPKVTIPGSPDLSQRIIGQLLETVDISWAQEWKFDHGLAVPLNFLTPEYKMPIIPVNINCQAPPLTPLHRAWALGKALRQAIDAVPEKVALISTGGTSHWPCTPESGKINLEWDKVLVDQLIHKRKDELLDYKFQQTFIDGGAGAGEMRTSICVAAACEETVGEVLFFEPIPVFATTCVIATCFQG